LAEGLARDHGCRISVITGVPQGQQVAGWAAPKGWRLITKEPLGEVTIFRAKGTRFPKHILLGRIVNYLTYFGSACLAGLQLERPDVVIALTDPPIIGLAALLTAKRFRCPVVISYRDIFPEVTRLIDGFHNPPVEWALQQVNRILVRQANRVVTLGEDMRSRLIQEKGAPPQKVAVIPDWADSALIAPGPKRNRFSLAHGLADSFVVMHSGNMGASQNLEVLLEAAALLKDLPNLLFVLIGDGVKKPSLQAQTEQLRLGNVRFFPYQPKEILSDVFACADCFIVSLKEGMAGYIMPSKIYGILAAGRPYIAAVEEACDVTRITHRYHCGLLAKPADPQDLAEKIQILYRDRVLAQRLGENARQAAYAFDRREGVRAYFNLCCELTHG
jgi:colanic acid biosynthesis glycosyl transferase WcaI